MAENVVLQKDFPVATATEAVAIYLTEQDTKIGDVISKPTDYWYEIELNPYTNPQTIIGYDEDGARVFKLFPEGRDLVEDEPEIEEEDIPVVDEELDLTSTRPVENQAVARAIAQLEASMPVPDGSLREDKFSDTLKARTLKDYVTPQMFGAVGDGETDDTEAVQIALTSGAECVYFPKGSYLISDTIDIPANKIVQMEGHIESLSGVDLEDLAGADLAIINFSGSAAVFTLHDGAKLMGGLIYAPESLKVIVLNVGTEKMRNVMVTSAILGAKLADSCAVYFAGATGTVGSLCFSTFASAIHGFKYAYYVDRPSGNLPCFTFCELARDVERELQGVFHNLTSYGNAFSSSTYKFTVCGGYVWKNAHQARCLT